MGKEIEEVYHREVGGHLKPVAVGEKLCGTGVGGRMSPSLG